MRLVVYALLIGIFVTGLVGCSSSEEKAQSRFDEAYRVAQAGAAADAEQLYRQLLVDYPDTPGAQKAQEQLQQLQEKREQGLVKSAFAALSSAQRVVVGYQSFSQRWPQSFNDFDNDEFLFDSDYMAASVSAGFTVYLVLTGDERFKVWSFPEQSELAFQLKKNGRAVVAVDKKRTLAEIESAYQVEVQKGRLFFLIPRT